ncbi:hypothetical protein ACFPRL_11005 [Pseudoclavibacter helvolus]
MCTAWAVLRRALSRHLRQPVGADLGLSSREDSPHGRRAHPSQARERR